MRIIRVKYVTFIILAIVLIAVPATGLSCEEEEEPEETAPPDRMGLASMLVPDTDFDIYVYIKQASPTAIFRDIIGTPFDVNVVSMAVWGIAAGETYALSGGLEFSSPAEAADIHGQVSGKTDIWTSLSQETIYFAHGSGTAVDTFKSAISANRFKYYDDEAALAQISLFPDSDTMKLIGLATAKPGPTLVDVIVRNTAPDASELLDVLLNTANLQIITTGLYSQNQIDVSTIVANPELTNILASQAGILASAKSEWPGMLLGPIVRRVLETAGYEVTVQGECTVYRGYLDLGLDEAIPVLFRVEDNRLFVALSLQESYATLLISNIVD